MNSKRFMIAVTAVAVLMPALDTVVAEEISPPYVIRDGRRIPGTEVRADRRGQIILSTETGRMTFEPGTTVVVHEPDGFDQLRRNVEEGNYEEAISGLRRVIEEYRFLGWDHRARRFLARALTGVDRFEDAVATFEQLFEDDPMARTEPAVQEAYLLALQGMGAREKLLPMLGEVIRDGERRPAAKAQMIRGNLRLEEGQTEQALYDFLRTARLFRSVIELQPEALYRVADCYERLGLHEKAQPYIERLQEEFPESDYAQRRRGS